MPHGTGKSVKVAAFCTGADVEAAKAAGVLWGAHVLACASGARAVCEEEWFGGAACQPASCTNQGTTITKAPKFVFSG